jgi:probable HAF family extracellular repeat protein
MPFRLQFSMLLALALLAAPPGALADPRYTVKVIAGPGSTAVDINRSGQVVGVLHDGEFDRAFLYSGSTLLELGTLGGDNSYARAINDSGRVVGSADNAEAIQHGFLYSGGRMRDLGTLGGLYSSAEGINNAGRIVGGSSTSDTFEGILPVAYIYSRNRMNAIGTLPDGDSSIAHAINNPGQVVGRSAISTDDPPEHPYHAFLYSRGVMTDLGTLGGLFSYATAINDAGAIVGEAGTGVLWPSGHFVPHAFLFVDGAMQDLGAFGGEFAGSQAHDINNRGQIVGASDTGADVRAFLYEGGTMLDLNALIDPAEGWTIVNAQGINDVQQIAATACRAGECFAVRLDLASPAPEPDTCLMLLGGLALLSLRLRRTAAT